VIREPVPCCFFVSARDSLGRAPLFPCFSPFWATFLLQLPVPTGRKPLLQAVAAKLREAKYLPIIFYFERPQDRDYTETVKTLAGLSRFIIADLSGPSVPQELFAIVPHFAIPIVPILEKGRASYAMFVDLFTYPWVLRPPIEFADLPDLLARIPSEVIAPAEEKHQARQQLLDELFRQK
jgi:hypothetical protein